MKRFLKRLLFGNQVKVEPMYMSVFKDRYGNLYGGAINPLDKAKQCVDVVSHIDSPKYLGKLRVWFLLWNVDKINPNYIRDYMRSSFQVWMHRHWLKLQILSLIIFWLINPLIVVFIISPTVVMTLHYSGFINVNGHWYGEARNIPEIRLTQPLSWRHGEHHRDF